MCSSKVKLAAFAQLEQLQMRIPQIRHDLLELWVCTSETR